jgi:hypothetical protein
VIEGWGWIGSAIVDAAVENGEVGTHDDVVGENELRHRGREIDLRGRFTVCSGRKVVFGEGIAGDGGECTGQLQAAGMSGAVADAG